MTQAEEVLLRLTKKENVLNKLLWVLIASIIVMIGSVSSLTSSQIQNKKDIEYVRENAANRTSVIKLTESFDGYRGSIKELIKDPEIRLVIDHFDAKMDKITDDIIMWNSEIHPRGATGGSK